MDAQKMIHLNQNCFVVRSVADVVLTASLHHLPVHTGFLVVMLLKRWRKARFTELQLVPRCVAVEMCDLPLPAGRRNDVAQRDIAGFLKTYTIFR